MTTLNTSESISRFIHSSLFQHSKAFQLIAMLLSIPCLVLISLTSYADVDSDNDGLVDIYNLDQLNAIRYNIDGTGLTLTDGGVTDSDGCFGDSTGAIPCNGYELMNNLDFDTNNDGLIDASDDYWNAGEGWLPIGESSSRFNTELNGNFYEIKNLYIDRDTFWLGLFAITDTSSTIQNLRLTGPLSSVTGGTNSTFSGMLAGINDGTITRVYVHAAIQTEKNGVGGLVGINRGPITQSYTSGQVEGTFSVGGLVGDQRSNSSETSTITDSYSVANVIGSSFLGGIAGDSETSFSRPFTVNNVYATGAVSGSNLTGGLFGVLVTEGNISSAHWDLDTTTKTQDIGSGGGTSDAIGLTTVEMQCPTAPDDTSCKSGSTLYAGWDPAIWEFNSSSDYPTLWAFGDLDNDSILNGADNDSDNDLMTDDWETNYGLDLLNASDALLDADNDGITNLDEFNQGTNPTIANAPNQTNTGITRAELAKPLVLAKHGLGFIPVAETGTLFADVDIADFHASYIEQLFNDGITNGCAATVYCPTNVVTKEQLAILLLKTKFGSAYTPPTASGTLFNDVSNTDFNADWIEDLFNRGISTGCDANNFCPKQVVTPEGLNNMLNLAFP